MPLRTHITAVAAAAVLLGLPGTALADDVRGDEDRARHGHVKLKKPRSKRDFPVHVPARAHDDERASKAGTSPPLGTEKIWPVIDFLAGDAVPESFTLRAAGDRVEVWVAEDLSFPAGDCRNDGVRNVVDDEAARSLAKAFDRVVHPRLAVAYSTPPPRSGENAYLEQIGAFPPGYFAGDGNKVVVLVANLRDPNYGDVGSPNYISGYHDATIGLFVDRHVVSIDSFDWPHRTGHRPPHEPSADACSNMPAQPHRYEGVLAHEYTHLLSVHESPGESLWVEEGLADYALTLTGYGLPERPVTKPGWDGHVQTFLGWRALATPANPNPVAEGGPENSLTVWGDQGGAEILADYGAAWTFMEYLAERYGWRFMRELHREDAKGLKGLQAVLDARLTGDRAQELIRDWAAMVALDAELDHGVRLHGRPKARDYRVETLDASVNWDNPESHASPGAPPNGSDYVRLRDASGRYLKASQLEQLSFEGVERLDPAPVEWVAEPDGADTVLYSGADIWLDRSVQRAVTVPALGDRTLTLETKWEIELGWDFGVVQVSTDEGRTWTSLANASTTEEHDPAAAGLIEDSLPGFTGRAGWHVESFDLSAYAGRTLLLRFRMLTDAAGLGNGARPGWWVDDVRVGGVLVSDGTLAGWSEISPFVAGYSVQLVSLGGRRDAALERLELEDGRRATLDRRALRRLVREGAELVAAIVTFEEPTESVTRNAPYVLVVNGVAQPGG